MNLKKLNEMSDEIASELADFKGMCDAGNPSEEVAISILKKEIEFIMMKMIQNLYYILQDHPITTAQSMVGVKIANEPESLSDYYNNMLIMQSGATKLKKSMDILKNGKGSENDYLHNYIKSRDDFAGFIESIVDFTRIAIVLVEQADKKSNQEYYKILNQNLNYMSRALNNASKYIYCWEKYGDNYVDVFNGVKNFFNESENLIKEMIADSMKLNKETQSNSPVFEKKINPARIVKVEQDEKTKARLAAINEANDLYERFQVDFMRDLQKEVSMMNRDMYEALIDKVEKFLKRFPMPLSNDVSLGMAIEARSQVSKFIEAVYDISRNTYTPVVFSK